MEFFIAISGEPATPITSPRPTSTPFANCSMKKGFLKWKEKFYIPCAREPKAEFITENHDSPYSRHLGQLRPFSLPDGHVGSHIYIKIYKVCPIKLPMPS